MSHLKATAEELEFKDQVQIDPPALQATAQAPRIAGADDGPDLKDHLQPTLGNLRYKHQINDPSPTDLLHSAARKREQEFDHTLLDQETEDANAANIPIPIAQPIISTTEDTQDITATPLEDDPDFAQLRRRLEDLQKERHDANENPGWDFRKWCLRAVLPILLLIVVSTIAVVFVIREPSTTFAPRPATRVFQAFETEQDLQSAVDDYIVSSDKAASQAASVYGFPIGAWDVSKVTNFTRLFDPDRNPETATTSIFFDEDLSRWDVSRATTMRGMFAGASFFTGDVSLWNTDNVEDMSDMFLGASAFDGNLTYWNVSKVNNLRRMFANAASFSSDISMWDTANVNDMSGVFYDASAFNSDLSQWKTSKVTSMLGTFARASSFNSDLSQWVTSQVATMIGMFENAASFSSDLSLWDTSNVNDMAVMFNGASAFNTDLSQWNTAKVTTMKGMFGDAASFSSDLSLWDTGNVTDMSFMFRGASAFGSDLSQWTTSKVTTMSIMFGGAVSFFSDLSSWDTANVNDMLQMFGEASGFNSNISSWNVSRVSNFEDMFLRATAFNYSLCSWGEQTELANVVTARMFVGSGCAATDDPSIIGDGRTGPWCQMCS